MEENFLSNEKKEQASVTVPQKAPKNKGIKIKANGIKDLKFSSKVSEFVIQYKFETKYPNPNIQPILKDIHFPSLYFEIKKTNSNGKVIKLIKKKLYGGKLNEQNNPSVKGIIIVIILFCNCNVNLFMKII